MMVLGIDMRIRRFTPAAAKLLNLLPADTGRPIGNIKTTIELPELEKLVEAGKLQAPAAAQIRRRLQGTIISRVVELRNLGRIARVFEKLQILATFIVTMIQIEAIADRLSDRNLTDAARSSGDRSFKTSLNRVGHAPLK